MCGIVGFVGKNDNWREEIHSMCQRIKHRGPDAEGVWTDEKTQVVLGHRRLSILDLSEKGTQPMRSENGRYIISYNGEIYNFKLIAKELRESKKTNSLKSNTDTEILLEAISKWGILEALKKTRGMFALALYDRVEDALYLARDRVGEKPLYYGMIGGKFAFASDLACLEQMKSFNNEVCLEALKLYFQHGYIPSPYSIYNKIYKLEPGTVLKVTQQGKYVEKEKYWSIQDVAINGQNNIFDGSEEEATEELKKILKQSVQMQMLADVPVGAFLSAGIDSSTIVSLMQDVSKIPVKTFTIGVENNSQNEAVIAKEISKILGTNHTEWYISEKEAQKIIPELSYYYSEPFADSSQIPTMLVSKLAKQQVTVSLSGDAGDELFAGYVYYEYVRRIWTQITEYPEPLRNGVKWAFDNVPRMYNSKTLKRGEFLKCQTPEELYTWSRKGHFADLLFKQKIKAYSNNELCRKGIFKEYQQNIMLMDMQMYLPDDILVKVDRAAMAYSLETRIPLLDADIIEFAWRLPFDYKKQGGVTKKVLRNILYQYVPKEIIDRPKTGFTIPLENWLRQKELREWAEDILLGGTFRDNDVFNYKAVCNIWREYIEDGKMEPRIWYLLMYGEWLSKRNISL